MIWLYKNYLYALTVVPVFILLSFFIRRRNIRMLVNLRINSFSLKLRVFLIDMFFMLFLVFIILAAAGPMGGSKPVTEELAGLNMAFVIDISRSMLAEDIKPNRLKKSVSAVKQMYKSLEGSYFSLIPFKGDAEIAVPVTADYRILDLWLDKLSPKIFSEGGSNLEKALEAARKSFPATDGKIKIVVLITDGEFLAGSVDNIIRKFAIENIPVFVLGAGSVEGALIPLGDGKYVTDSENNKVVSKLNLKTLKNIAKVTKGEYRDLSDSDAVTETINSIFKLEKLSKNQGVRFKRAVLYGYFLFAALVSLFMMLFIRTVAWERN